MPPHDRRALNTTENATKAIATVQAQLKTFTAGKIWRHKTPHGSLEIKGALMFGDAIAAVLHFSSEDGSVLPKGLHGYSEGDAETLKIIEGKLKVVPEQLTVVPGVEFREPEFCWAVPLILDGRIVAHVKVDAAGDTVISDRKAAEELARNDR